MKIKLYSKCVLTLTVCTLVFTSCKKYLDIKPKGVQTLNTVSDYDQWLNSFGVESEPVTLNDLSDNQDMPSLTTPAAPGADYVYLWQPQFDTNLTDAALIWPDHYKSIYYFNTVIAGIDQATGGTDQQKASLKAEALLGRAFEYLYLVNEYGKLYNNATAGKDLAVPFVTSNDLATPTPNRSTVQQVYDQIIGDLNAAIPNLPADNSKNRCRGSVAAAYSILARTYLWMGNYAQAQKYAQMALDNGNSVMVDYNTLTSSDGLQVITVRPDAIYGRTTGSTFDFEQPASSFLKLYSNGDLRLKFFYLVFDPTFTARSSAYVFIIGAAGQLNWGTSAAEMHLILAEAAARGGDLTTALAQLDMVRKDRIATASYTTFSSTDPAAVLQAIITERDLEMGFSGMRWFDMRRLAAEGLMPTVTRLDGSGNVVATLAPGSPRYTLQVPVQVMQFHPDWVQNP